jgi:hypothetical protein
MGSSLAVCHGSIRAGVISQGESGAKVKPLHLAQALQRRHIRLNPAWNGRLMNIDGSPNSEMDSWDSDRYSMLGR